MTLALRKIAEVNQKLASLPEEFEHWRTEASYGGLLERHHTQVQAITNQLTVAADSLDYRIRELAVDTIMTKAGAIEGVILDLHRIWDLFRSKLALRYLVRFEHYLRTADEFAYSCYGRAESRGANREPALLYFGGERSPVIRPRGATLSSVRRAAHATDPLAEAIDRLPVPLIGIPWFQAAHLPEAPVIAHEVGHDVEFDLALPGTVQRFVDRALVQAGVDESRRRGWQAWRPELFADVFATLALGPAFTSTLIDVLATDPHAVTTEFQGDPIWRPHPPRTLRVLISTATLKAMDADFAPAAEGLLALWFKEFPSHAMDAFAQDIPHVVAAIIAGPYDALEGGPLTRLIALSSDMWQSVQRDAHAVLQRLPPHGSDARALIAAARIAYDADPLGYQEAAVHNRILNRIGQIHTRGVRGGSQTPVDASDRWARDQKAGLWLAAYLEAAHGLRDPKEFPATAPWAP